MNNRNTQVVNASLPICYLNNKVFSNKSLVIYLIQIGSWILAANLFIVLKVWGIQDQTGYLVFTIPNNLLPAHFMASIMGFGIGIILVFIDNIRINSPIMRQGLGVSILIKGMSYLVTIVLIVLIVTFAFLLILASGIDEALYRHKYFVGSNYFIVIILYGTVVSLIISFIRQVDAKFGPGNLLNMLVGKYQSPKVEDRVFMFLDLKNATPYAEKLGHLKYSRMLQDCFLDITKVIRKYHAEVYQYVGDEIVLTWRTEMGTRHANCIHLYYEFINILRNRTDYYIRKYGMMPEFKAGLNCGHVTVAEIGSFKREIAYHGDVINTASRIQCQCNTYGKKLLASGQLIKRLNGLNGYEINFAASARLKGKKLPVEIYSVEHKTTDKGLNK